MLVRKLPLAVALLAGCESPALFVAPSQVLGQSPSLEDGHVSDHTYENAFLGFSYPLPRGWYVNAEMATDSQGRPKHLTSSSALLLVADQHRPDGGYKNRLLIVADNAIAYQPNLTVNEYVSKVVSATARKPGVALTHATFPAIFAGRHFYRANYSESGNGIVAFKTFVCTKVRGYFLSWTFVVPNSPEELEQLVNSLQRVSFQRAPPPEPAAAGEAASPLPPQDTVRRPLRIRISQLVSEGLIVKKVQPVYPYDARVRHIEGSVVMKAEINTQGDVTDLQVISGDPALVPSALAAVGQWKYKPYLLSGQAVEVETQVTVAYNLTDR
jgi:TonB family protein